MPFRLLGLLVPDEGQMLHDARFLSRLEEVESRAQNLPLGLAIAYITEGPPERMLDRRDTGHADGPLKRPQHVQCDGRDAPGLDLSCDQPHGPATIGSDRREKRKVDLLAAHGLRNLRRALLDQIAGIAALEAHDRIVALGTRTHAALVYEFAEPIDR